MTCWFQSSHLFTYLSTKILDRIGANLSSSACTLHQRYLPSSLCTSAVLDLTLMEFKQKVRASNCFSCCFGASGSTDDLEERPISMIRSSSTWLKERAQELPEFSERCRGIVDRIRWRRRFTGEFSYDPLSYARNFDEGLDEIGGDDAAQGDAFRYKDFSSRLPPSPPPRPLVAIS
ncbi:hypothetical protein LUZ63_003372 [Rhynchospora breviuscula]|uniref:Uncharacterized protein n=1 Tax=Rhynchospora breviuscula TaxID=2022672 RepID=A0A9Q0D155_9POAL|nr:hypothetical protein LUZ63_003372 [Rhynchospora breviuscula]